MLRRPIIGVTIVVGLVLVIVGAYLLGTMRENRSTTMRAADSAPSQAISSQSRILTVYFSRTTGVWQGPLEIGNTKRIADDITATVGGDQFEIIPEQDYPDEYEPTTDIAAQEQRENARPALKNPAPDVSSYDVVFLGAPVWWGEYPMVVRTFMDQVDLNGKTVIPFATHEGSGLGAFPSQIQQQWPNATVPQGFSVRGTQAADAAGDVREWLGELGLSK